MAVAAGTFAAASSAIAAVTDACFSARTPPQSEGPFYPVNDQLDKDTDLTQVTGGLGKAKGQMIFVTGTILDQNCRPIKGARIEIWQACESGRYNHPNDESGLPLDRNFQYWGIAHTGTDGKYIFKTIKPGSYPAGSGWIRPPHIHYKVSALGFHELTTQLYFSGDPLNDKDLILKALPSADQKKVVVPLSPAGPEFNPNSLLGDFSITLQRVV
ncbi:MAG: hypothetical protein HYR96_13445 [Deltaproteobacteria bacterium]|nr:hypothetical protein [Deltaproteobacteria bacterium]MBI3295584.1 hypothetical protein [Deltaproteobacteria bacterium]